MATLKEIDPLLYGLIGANDFTSCFRSSDDGPSTVQVLRQDFEERQEKVRQANERSAFEDRMEKEFWLSHMRDRQLRSRR